MSQSVGWGVYGGIIAAWFFYVGTLAEVAPPWWLPVAIFFAVALGEVLSYWLGRRVRWWWARRHPGLLQCTRAPVGWRCAREAGHDGPCAAWRIR
jgi:hypothetical protein